MTPQQFKQTRTDFGLTQMQMAKLIGKSWAQVQNYEYSKYPVPELVAFKLTHITKKDLRKLLQFNHSPIK